MSKFKGRHRDEDGEASRKHGNTQVGNLRKTYGDDFAKDYRSDAHLKTVLNDSGASSLSDYLRKHRK